MEYGSEVFGCELSFQETVIMDGRVLGYVTSVYLIIKCKTINFSFRRACFSCNAVMPEQDIPIDFVNDGSRDVSGINDF
jgi:hypothetical protein